MKYICIASTHNQVFESGKMYEVKTCDTGVEIASEKGDYLYTKDMSLSFEDCKFEFRYPLIIYAHKGCGDCDKLMKWMKKNSQFPDKIIAETELIHAVALDKKIEVVPFAEIDGKMYAGLYSIRRKLTCKK